VCVPRRSVGRLPLDTTSTEMRGIAAASFVPLDSVHVNFDQGQARLRARNLNVFDDHDIANSVTLGLGLPGDLGFPYPAIAGIPPVRAIVSFDVEWNGVLATAEIDNSTQHFKGSFLSTGAAIQWSAEQDGFGPKRRPRRGT
jgi:hypothetical protein